tara:strand:+ start:374 stop:1294 length:921 start_codon:yes stop_codon:yes gene_type:complete
MKIAIIGRTEILYDTMVKLKKEGHEISCIVTSKEAPEYSKTSEDFREIARQWNIPFAIGSKISDHFELLSSSNADIGVSINYTGIIPQSTIDLFPLGILNSHGGDLPKYRGNACQAWAIINGEEKIGLCIHKMIGGELDSGDIIARDYLPINLDTKITEVWKWMSLKVPELFVDSVNKIEIKSDFFMEKQSKNESDASRCYPLLPDDGRINWNRSATEIIRLINAFNKPYHGAFCYFNDEKIVVWDSELVLDEEIFYSIPGQVTKIGSGFIEVACMENKIRLKKIEINSKIDSPDKLIKSIRTRLI